MTLRLTKKLREAIDDFEETVDEYSNNTSASSYKNIFSIIHLKKKSKQRLISEIENYAKKEFQNVEKLCNKLKSKLSKEERELLINWAREEKKEYELFIEELLK